MQYKKVNNTLADGFTIIETMIVLALAGLIFLITFLAIPSLYAHIHNDQRKADVGAILQFVSSYELNNSGNFPPSCGPASNNTALSCDSSSQTPTISPFEGKLLSKLSWYDNDDGGDGGISIVPLGTSAGNVYYAGNSTYSSLTACGLDEGLNGECTPNSLLSPSSSDPDYNTELNADNYYVTIYDYERCAANPINGVIASSQGAGYSDIVAIYMVENGDSNTFEAQCQQLAS